jgi:hypothetical protein
VSKSSEAEQAQRVNATLSLLRQKTSPGEVVSWLVTHYGLSQRQAYRYLQHAQQISGPLPVPESKAVFTVKLPRSLIAHVRKQAWRQGEPISQWVAQALRQALQSGQGHG